MEFSFSGQNTCNSIILNAICHIGVRYIVVDAEYCIIYLKSVKVAICVLGVGPLKYSKILNHSVAVVFS